MTNIIMNTFISSSQAITTVCLQAGDHSYLYSRWRNPTVVAVADVIQRLEEAEGTLLFPSGMAAITTTILTTLKTGDHIVC